MTDQTPPLDPRDPRPEGSFRHPMFRYHNCHRCRDGERDCVQGNPNGCEYPHARND